MDEPPTRMTCACTGAAYPRWSGYVNIHPTLRQHSFKITAGLLQPMLGIAVLALALKIPGLMGGGAGGGTIVPSLIGSAAGAAVGAGVGVGVRAALGAGARGAGRGSRR